MSDQATDLYWLQTDETWGERLARLPMVADADARWAEAVALANAHLDIGRTSRLARAVALAFSNSGAPKAAVGTIRLAVLASSTVSHLLASLSVGALRRGFWLEMFVTDYNQYFQELHKPRSALELFRPTDVLLSFDAHHMTSGLDYAADAETTLALKMEKLEHLKTVWTLCRNRFDCSIIQQAVLPVFAPLMGSAEHRLPGSPVRFVSDVNEAIRSAADECGVDVLSIDERCCRDGLTVWHQAKMWFMAKQEIAPSAAPLYGDLVARLIGAQRGRSCKALVLDLDNTLWGGVAGDDGADGVVVGQGSALGESFLALQHYAKALARRGIILAVCSKNDRANAVAVFENRRDMLLQVDDFAAFEANWDDKALNLRRIAKRLNIGLDALVFVDDNPFERNLVRSELPMVAVPEVPEEPALVARCLADAGYFESTRLSQEDKSRSKLYADNTARVALQQQTSDIEGYLRSLQMRLLWRPFDKAGLPRIGQLINKTNQFNLTTRRYTDADIMRFIASPKYITLQLRLVDRFGDNGMIAVVIGECQGDILEIDTWLMSCRVLGRRVEDATLNILTQEARRRGLQSLTGRYRATEKNEMVRDHYATLGFVASAPDEKGLGWVLSTSGFEPIETAITVVDDQSP